MKFTTVIPLYNKQDTIRRAIYSVLEQQCTNAEQHELIIVDDGSSDKSLIEAHRIQTQLPHRKIIVHSQTNAGVSAARNKGIELASNELITFLDADDSYEVNFYQEITELVKKFPNAAAFATGYRFVNTNQGTKCNAKIVGLGESKHQELSNFFHSAANGDLPITSSSVCIKKTALQSINGFPVGENMGEDQAVWSQLALHYDIAISQIICANYFEDTATGNSLMQTIAPNQEMPYSQRLQKQLTQSQIPTRLEPSVRHYIAGHLLDLARRNLLSGNLETAKKLLNDKRCKKQLKRWAYWRLQVNAQRCSKQLTTMFKTATSVRA